MASDKEVSLVVKLKNEASATAKLITDSLKDLATATSDLGKGAAKNGNLLGELGKELNGLLAQSKGLEGLTKIVGQLDKVGQTVAKVESNVKEAATALAALARESETATSVANRLNGQLQTQIKIRDENNQALRAAQTELTKADRAVIAAEKNLERYNATLAKTPKPQSAITSAGTFIQSDVNSARAAQEALTRDVALYGTNLSAAKKAILDLAPQVKIASANQRTLAADTQAAANALREEKNGLDVSRTALTDIRAAATGAASALGLTDTNLSTVNSEAKRTTETIEKLTAALKTQAAATKTGALNGPFIDPTQASAATAANGGGAAAQSRAAFQAQVAAVQVARNAMNEAAVAATSLGKALSAADVPTEELARDFLLAKSNAAAAEQAFNEQVATLARMRTQTAATVAEYVKLGNIKAVAEAAATAQNNLAAATNNAAVATAKLPPIAARFGAAMGGAAKGSKDLAVGLDEAANSSRSALGIMERIRAEVLSLALAYVGLRAAISQIGGVVEAFQTIQAAQSRLGVVFNQNTGKITSELAFLQQEAARLGISFETLADQYSKFAVAANQANFTSESTRKIFLSVAEAARVNRLSVEQTEGVFLALEQMISKGKVSSEELRRQLGDRLAGAFNIFADALGVTTAQLDKLMRQGQVLADETTLLAFGDQLTKKFGPELGTALASTSAQIGRFQNELFQAQLRVAEGGFIDALTKGLVQLNTYFQSREGRDFFLGIGESLGKAVNGLVALLPYMAQLKTVILIIIGYSLRNYVLSIGTAFVSAARGADGFARSLTTANASIKIASTLGAGVLRIFGGIPGIIATAALLLFSSVGTGVSQANSAIDEHRRIMDLISAAYIKAGKDSKDWLAAIAQTTAREAATNLTKLRQALEDTRKENEFYVKSLDGTENALRGIDPANRAIVATLLQLQQNFVKSTQSVADYKTAIEAAVAGNPDKRVQAVADALISSATASTDATTRFHEAEAVVATFNNTATDAQKALLGIAPAAENAGSGIDKATAAFEKYDEAVDKLKSKNPLLSEQMKELKKDAEIEDAFALAQKALDDFGKTADLDISILARMSDGLRKLKDAAKDAVDVSGLNKMLDGFTSINEQATKLISKFEGFQSKPIVDSDGKLRIGFSSDTQTAADGTVTKVAANSVATLADAVRDLNRRMIDYVSEIKSKIGDDAFNALSTKQVAVLESIVHNYGELPSRLVAALKTGDASAVADQIRALGSDNGGRNQGRRDQEAAIFQGADQSKDVDLAIKKQDELDKKQKEYDGDIQRGIDLRKAETAGQEESSRAATIAKAVQEAKNKAADLGVQITQAQIAEIEKSVGAEYDAKHAAELANKARKDGVNEIIGLDQQRADLMKQFQLAQKQGDAGAIDSTKGKIEELTQKINDLLPAAQQMAEKLGDQKMIATLQAVNTHTQQLSFNLSTASSNAKFLGLNVSQLESVGHEFASGLTSAVGDFFQGLKDGKSTVDALKDAFLNFASNFLLKIGEMILEQEILNALQSFFPGLNFGTAHLGGVVGSNSVGSGNARRAVDPAVFAGAKRFHGGGLPGLRPDEVPTILKKGEEVLTGDDPRNVLNGGLGANRSGSSSQPKVDLKIVNTIDSADFVNQGLNTQKGTQALLNVIKANSSAVKAAIG